MIMQLRYVEILLDYVLLVNLLTCQQICAMKLEMGIGFGKGNKILIRNAFLHVMDLNGLDGVITSL